MINKVAYCDINCEYAKFQKEVDESRGCRTFVGLYCSYFNKVVDKNKLCRVYKRRDE